VKLLLDTHALLWALARPGELAPEARRRLQDPGNTVFVSVASAWEMEIKRALGKLDALLTWRKPTSAPHRAFDLFPPHPLAEGPSRPA